MPDETKKILKQVIQNEIAPLLIGLRTEIEDIGKIYKQGQSTPVSFSFTPEAIKEIKHHDGKTPERGVDYFNEEDVDAFIKASTPVKGKDYFTKKEIISLKADIKKEIKPVKNKDYFDGVTPVKGKDYFTKAEIKEFLAAATPVKGIHYKDGTPGAPGKPGKSGADISAVDIRNKLESLKGTERLSISAIKGLTERLDALSVGNGMSATSDAGTGGISNITGLIDEGTGISITGLGTIASPYVITATGGGGSVDWGDIGGTLADQIDLVNAFNTKQDSLVSTGNIKSINGNSILGAGDLVIGGVTAVTATGPLVSSGGTTPDISMPVASTVVDGYLGSSDFITFNNKVSSQWVTSASDIYYNTGKVQVGNSSIGTSKFNVYSATGAIQKLETSTTTLDLDFVSTVGQGAIGINSDAIYIQALDSLSNGIYFWPNTAGSKSLHLLSDGHIRHEYSNSIYMDTFVDSGGSANFAIGGGGGLGFKFNRDIYTDEGLYLDTGNIALYATGTGGGSSLTLGTFANNRTIEFNTKISGVQAIRGGFYTDGFGITGDFRMSTVGKGIYITEGSNATMGTATLSSGTVTVSTTKVTANSRIFLTVNGGTLTNVGSVYVSARSAGTSFTISSINILDTSDVAWIIVEPL